MKKNNQNNSTVKELNFHFDNRSIVELTKKLYDGEITFEEYEKKLDEI